VNEVRWKNYLRVDNSDSNFVGLIVTWYHYDADICCCTIDNFIDYFMSCFFVDLSQMI
jgi:hypothetical protein